MTTYPAKILLFGEYSILLGSSALGTPFSYFNASLAFPDEDHGEDSDMAKKSNLDLKRMAGYFSTPSTDLENILDLQRLANDIDAGLYFASTIPQRYGMGSSGALCAAVYDRYHSQHDGNTLHTDSQKLLSLRNIFTRMESFFHGRSSGFDPLLSILRSPLILGREGTVSEFVIKDKLMPENGPELLLVDSGQPCSTGPLVVNFLNDFMPDGRVTTQGVILRDMVNNLIGNLFEGNISGSLWDDITRLSRFQLKHLTHLVPQELMAVWNDGLTTGLFSMKLCGSGGGGFLLCFTCDKLKAIEYFGNRNLPVIDTGI